MTYEEALELVTPEMEQAIADEQWSDFERNGLSNREIAAQRIVSRRGWPEFNL